MNYNPTEHTAEEPWEGEPNLGEGVRSFLRNADIPPLDGLAHRCAGETGGAPDGRAP